jgi:hypothetical protein
MRARSGEMNDVKVWLSGVWCSAFLLMSKEVRDGCIMKLRDLHAFKTNYQLSTSN